MGSASRITAIDFFCGAGGLTRGLLNAGINVRAGVDFDRSLMQTYERNNSPSHFVHRNIRGLDIESLRENLGISARSLALYAACTPCQPFSTLAQRQGVDARKDLLLAFAEIVREAPPDIILVENVPGLNTKYGREIYERFLRIISRVGFHKRYVNAAFLDANDFGVPQTRRRFILFASRHQRLEFPNQILPKPTVGDCLSKFPAIQHGQAAEEYHNHHSRRLAPHVLRIVKAVPHDGGSRADILDTSILYPCHQRKPNVHRDVFGRMKWGKPAPTLTARCTDVYCGRFIHPEQDRGISVREAAALQTFPDEYIFYGKSILQLSRQIGNSVPVRFAEQLGKSIVEQLSN